MDWRTKFLKVQTNKSGALVEMRKKDCHKNSCKVQMIRYVKYQKLVILPFIKLTFLLFFCMN